jgi:hypothetical protein
MSHFEDGVAQGGGISRGYMYIAQSTEMASIGLPFLATFHLCFLLYATLSIAYMQPYLICNPIDCITLFSNVSPLLPLICKALRTMYLPHLPYIQDSVLSTGT